MIIGIVGSEAAKFTSETEQKAKDTIRSILSVPGVTGVSSGHSPLGGIDIWTEEIGAELGLPLHIFPPKDFSWASGYKPRNIQIARKSDVLHCITVKQLPADYKGMRFPFCYHCGTNDHVKSGGCWTVMQGTRLGKPGFWHVL